MKLGEFILETRFLILDDDIGFRKTISYIIEKYHLGVIAGSYGDGMEAEANIHECRPDIVIVDLLLPGQSGIELAKKIRSINNKIILIMVSASNNKSIINQAYLNGIDFYLQKPINVLELTKVIKQILEGKRQEQPDSYRLRSWQKILSYINLSPLTQN